MRSPRALVLLVSLAACDRSGLEIEVVPPVDGAVPDHVRLFIGKSEEKTGGIAPEGFAASDTRYGNIWVRDPKNGADMLPISPGETISFGFLAEADNTELGAIVAVGYTGGVPTSAGSLFHLETGVGNVRVFQIQLHPAFDPRDRANRDEELQVEIWGPEVSDETCLHLRNKRPDRDIDHEHHDIFIVAEGDRDCDGYADDDDALECKAEVHDARRLAEPAELACALPLTIAGGGSSLCVLGGPRCVDGLPRNPTECTPSRFCAPQSMCTACQQLSGPAEQDCIRDPFPNAVVPGTMFGIACHVASTYDPDNPALPASLCGLPLTLSMPIPQMTMLPTCSNATIASVGSPAQDRLAIGDLRFDVDVSSSCDFKLTPGGDLPSGATVYSKVTGLVTVDLDTGRSIALPIQITIDPPLTECGNRGACSFTDPANTTDRLDACLAAPRPDLP